jgi:SAM-dependent methyltransferase
MQQPSCNLCTAANFVPHMGRPGERCASCGSLRRHRIAFALYERFGMFSGRESPPYGMRVLHLAPEGLLHDHIRRHVGAGYMPADARPEVYTVAQCLRLFLPDDFKIFPSGYFDFAIHNHVLEHVPGTFRDHIPEFCRILKPGGYHVFSVPGPKMGMDTIEGGEHLGSDEERLRLFGQIDHFKQFGRDLPAFLAELPGGEFFWDPIADDERAALNIEPNSNRFLVWRKH